MCVVNVSFMVVVMSKPQGELTPQPVNLAIPLSHLPPAVVWMIKLNDSSIY